MKKILTIILTLIVVNVLGQKKTIGEGQAIVAEGKLLYKSEMASWHGTDLFLNTYKNQENIGGYFSYTDNDTAKCIFFSKTEKPKVIGTISFDSTYNVNTAITETIERDFTKIENDLYQIRKIALNELNTNTDSLFKFYQNTNPNLIPLIIGENKKVYVLTGAKQSGVVIFGNDYLLTFDNDNNVVTKKQLHKNIIPIEYGKTIEGQEVVGTFHNHSPETGELITATDICTLMLYAKFAKWKTHNVVSKEYLNTWNCETNTLTIIPMSNKEKINKHQQKQIKKKK
jgi:hypothetical protein